jgi:hypothetical protein
MKLLDPALVRRMVLAGSGLTFGVIALLGIVAPRAVARQYGFELGGVEAYNQFHAVFTGFWAWLAIGMVTAARRTDVPLLGDLFGLMLVLQAGGRALSFAVDGLPSWLFVIAFFAELASGVTILALRPKASAPLGQASGDVGAL